MAESFLEHYRKSNPFMDHCGIEAVVSSPECSEVTLTIRPESRNIHGVVHGGLLFTMADCVAGLTARADGREVFFISARDGIGIEDLVAALWKLRDEVQVHEPLHHFVEAENVDEEEFEDIEVIYTRE